MELVNATLIDTRLATRALSPIACLTIQLISKTVLRMADDSLVGQIADSLIEQHGATGALDIAETLASSTSGSGVEFWEHVAEAIRAKLRGDR